MKEKLKKTPKNCQGCGELFSEGKPMFVAIEWHAKRCGLCMECHQAMEVNGKLELPVTASFQGNDFGIVVDNELRDLMEQLKTVKQENARMLEEIKEAGF